MPDRTVMGKDGKPIKVGDRVWTPHRGGKQEGPVEAVVVDEKDVEAVSAMGIPIKRPPKVIYTDQHGHKVAHNPWALSHVE